MDAESSLREGLSLAFSGPISGEVIFSEGNSITFSVLLRPNNLLLNVFAETENAFGQATANVSPRADARTVTLTVTVFETMGNPTQLGVSVSNVLFLP